MITNPIHTKAAYLIWQSPLEGNGSRRRLPVAHLRCEGNGMVAFNYLFNTPEFITAQSEGFTGYLGIPLDRADTSDAIQTLGRRLLNSDRSDYADYLSRFGLSPNQNLSTLSLLAYTGARLTSDSFSVADTFEGFDRPFQYIFDVAGRRHSIDESPNLEVGDNVEFRADIENEFDEDAVEIVGPHEKRIGYVNACQTKAVRRWLKNGSINAQVFRINGRPSYPRTFIFAQIDPSST